MIDRRRLMLLGAAAGLAPAPAAALGGPGTARDAFIFTFPLYEMYRTRQIALGGQRPAQPNMFAHRRILTDDRAREVTTPNNDTLYSSAWLDLRGTALLLSLPDTGDRYYSAALMDMYTNNFACLGRRTTGTKAQEVVIAGPGWQGEAPAGLKVIRSPTPWAWALCRFLVDGPDDLPAVHALQDKCVLTPLSRGGGMTFATPTEVPPSDKPNDPAAYVPLVNRLLAENPPPARDNMALARFGDVGVRPDASGSALSLIDRGIWYAGLLSARSAMKDAGAAVGKPVDGWIRPPREIGNFGDDYMLRAIIALIGLGALEQAEAIYISANTDANGAALDGGARYRLRLGPGDLPPVDAFWSLSMYELTPDGRSFFTSNPIGRYAIGDRTRGLARATDGSIEIAMQREPPEGALRANWLPTPSGPFRVTLRAYQPKQAMLDGSYRPPGIVRLA